MILLGEMQLGFLEPLQDLASHGIGQGLVDCVYVHLKYLSSSFCDVYIGIIQFQYRYNTI